jgi:hypothetical protein
MRSSAAAAPSDTDDELSTACALTGPEGEAWHAMLRDANINPESGLATDYLNHFNEAIMLLEMIADIPECADDFLEWRPLSYREHFMASSLKARDLAVLAYDAANPAIKSNFDGVTGTMTSILKAVGDAMRDAKQDRTRIILAEQAAAWVKPLLLRADAIINGTGRSADIDLIMNR